MGNWATWLLIAVPLAAQAPSGWNQRTRLGDDQPGQAVWYGAGLWAADHHGPATPFGSSLGLGNALTGGGFHVEGGTRWGNWDLAAEVLGNRDTRGQAYATLYRSHIWYRGPRWQAGFEQEPLVWGYGLNGGYLLGEAARPFPRVRVQSPRADLRVFKVPLGSWGFQWFTGRLENHRRLAPTIQDASARSRAIAAQGDPQAPLVTGYRAEATFGPLLEFYLNWMVLWSGTRNGRGMTSGYGFGDYVTAMTGTKDALAEGGTDFTAGTRTTGFETTAQSSTTLDWGLRFQFPWLAGALGAEKAWLYVSRGTKSAFWPYRLFMRRPGYYAGKELWFDADNLLLRPNLATVWYQKNRYSAPALAQPNDTFGLQASWSRVRAGVEYYAGVNGMGGNFRPFAHGTYLTGFYAYGDPLGMALGGETSAATAKVEADLSRKVSASLTAVYGYRPFRDDPDAWRLDHPGAVPGKNRYRGLQQTLGWRVRDGVAVDLGAAWQRQSAVEYEQGRDGNGFAWFTDLSFRWPSRRTPGWSD